MRSYFLGTYRPVGRDGKKGDKEKWRYYIFRLSGSTRSYLTTWNDWTTQPALMKRFKSQEAAVEAAERAINVIETA